MKIVGLRDAQYDVALTEMSAQQGTSFTRQGTVRAGQTITIALTEPGGLRGDLDGDSDVDTQDVAVITAARNAVVPAGDPRDLNGDLKIDALDARVLTTLCTRPVAPPNKEST